MTKPIALLLNLNLAVMLTGDDVPMLDSYVLNIDVVEDLFGNPPLPTVPPTLVDPVFNNADLADVCIDDDSDDVCDEGTLELSDLGDVVQLLDDEETTVVDILDAADALLESGDDDIAVNGVTVSRGDMTKILSMINLSFHEGSPSGFVTAFDVD